MTNKQRELQGLPAQTHEMILTKDQRALRCTQCGYTQDDLTDVARHVVENQFHGRIAPR